jgi:hypothetical protein
VIKISFGCTRELRVKMWGTSLSEDKLAGDLGNVIEGTSISGRFDFFAAEKLTPSYLGLLQQCLPIADSCTATIMPAPRWLHGRSPAGMIGAGGDIVQDAV